MTYEHLIPAATEALRHVSHGSATEALLQAAIQERSDIELGYLEVSANRLIWWRDSRSRLVRVNLRSAQVDMLLANEVDQWIRESGIVRRQKMHDKNPAMVLHTIRDPVEAAQLARVFRYK